MISQTRWTMTQTGTANYSASVLGQTTNSGTLSGNVGGQIGVDEFVFDSSSNVLASLQEPPALISLLNSHSGCSFII